MMTLTHGFSGYVTCRSRATESAGPWQACQEALLPRVVVVPLGAAVRSAWIWLTG